MRTKAELLQQIDDDLIWRRRELLFIRAAVEAAEGNAPKQSAFLRAGVAILYAHWEGFVKRCGTYYLQFVAEQGHVAQALKPNFVAIKFRARLAEAAKSRKVSTTNDVVEYFCTKMGDRLRIPHKGVLDTASNLSSAVLADIVETLGLDAAPYETKRHLIDTKLVDRRNHIAHGDFLDLDPEDFLSLYDDVNSLMDAFRTQVQNAAATDLYLR